MSVEDKVQETCEACGCFAEIGTIIGEGDDLLTLDIAAVDEAAARAKLAEYQALAKEVYSDVQIGETLTKSADGVSLSVSLQFSCTAEKLIFEMRARSLA